MILLSLVLTGVLSAGSGSDSCLSDAADVYRSPSGQFALHAEPAPDRFHGGAYTLKPTKEGSRPPFGSEGAMIWLEADGTRIWEWQVSEPVTVAAVTDAGFVATCSYQGGIFGHSIGQPPLAEPNIFVMIFDPTGAVLLSDAKRRDPKPWVGGNPPSGIYPQVRGVVYIDVLKEFVVQVATGPRHEGKPHIWWRYSLEPAAFIEAVEFGQPQVADRAHIGLIASKSIPGTPLLLVHWLIHSRSDDDRRIVGVGLTVTDLSGREIWFQEFPRQYGISERLPGVGTLADSIIEQTACAEATFTFHSKEPEESLHFEVTRDEDASSWRVHAVRKESVP